jgi:hypothetical protein
VTPHEFLNLLWQYKPEDQYILIWTHPDKKSRWFTNVPAAADYVASINGGRDIYVGVGLSKEDYGPTRRCVAEEITGITAVWADLDLFSEAHQKPLPRTIPEALSIIPPMMPPTLVIATGNGIHAWWLLKEPSIFDNEEERKDAAATVHRWHTLLRINASAKGWAFERLADLSRVLRIPDTQNLKDSNQPKNVTVYSCDLSHRHNLSDFDEFLDDVAIPDPDAERGAARDWQERFADKPLVISLDSRIPQDLIDGWMAADMRFNNTWLRQRHDLKDQTNSGYDMALADFGVQAGLSEQQIVDLIVHHRALHGKGHRTRIDYYQRTIANASKRTLGETAPPPPVAATAATVQGNGHGDTADAAQQERVLKAQLCEHISNALGIRIIRLVKITGKDPTFHMELEVGKIEFDSIRKFATQEAIHYAVAAATGKFTRKIKPKDWERIKQMMLDACYVETGSVEDEFEAGGKTLIASYLSETGFIESVETAEVQNQKKPILKDGRVAVNTTDVSNYATKTLYKNITSKAVASMLRALGAEQFRLCGRKFKEQSRWLLPLEEFDPADYPAGQEKKEDAGDAAIQ